MSSKGERTREAVLEAAAVLLRRHGPAHVTMADVAAAVGLSRQALYLHFPNRVNLMVALIGHVGRRLGARALFHPTSAPARPREVLETMLRASVQYAARVHEVALALDLARHSDPAARAAWEDRMAVRRKQITALVRRLHAEGALREGWRVGQVADAVWALTLPHTYADLVIERRWSLEDYERFVLTTAFAFLSTEKKGSARSRRAG